MTKVFALLFFVVVVVAGVVDDEAQLREIPGHGSFFFSFFFALFVHTILVFLPVA